MTQRDTAPLACDMRALSGPERAVHHQLTARLLESVRHWNELNDGYAFELDPGRVAIVELAQWIDLERRCCPFFAFDLALAADEGPLTLRLTGRDGVKEVIRAEFPPAFRANA